MYLNPKLNDFRTAFLRPRTAAQEDSEETVNGS
jgi:hypothetical protein